MGHWMGKHREIVFEGILVSSLAYRCPTILQRDHIISQFGRCTPRRFDATVSQEAGQSHGLNFSMTQNEIKIGRSKPVQTSFSFDDNIFRLWFETVDDLCSPASFFECFTILTSFKDSIWELTDLANAWSELDRQRDNGGARGSRSSSGFLC